MNESEAFVEQVVRDVLRRLASSGALGQATTIAPADSANLAATIQINKQSPTSDPRELVLVERVISIAQLKGRLSEVRSVVVQRGAVVTPAARDLLRDMKIGLAFKTREATTTPEKATPAKAKLMIGVADANGSIESHVAAMKNVASNCEQIARTGLTNVTNELAIEVVRSGAKAILLTDRPIAAACVANRHRGVRAAVATNLRDAVEAMNELGANFLAIRPSATPSRIAATIAGKLLDAGQTPEDLKSI